jgi:hypothetical protein
LTSQRSTAIARKRRRPVGELGSWIDHHSAMFPRAVRPCLSPPKVPNIGTVRTCGPRDTSVLHGISFSAFGLVTKISWSEGHCGKWSRAEAAVGSDHRRRLWCSCADTVRTLLSSAACDDAFQRRQKSVRMGSSCADTVRSDGPTGYRFAAAMSRHPIGGFSSPMW